MKQRFALILGLLTGTMFASCPVVAELERDAIAQTTIAQESNHSVASGAVLTLEDLPSGFMEIPAVNLAPISQAIDQTDMVRTKGIFMFINPIGFEFVMGMTIGLSEEAKQRGHSLEEADLQELFPENVLEQMLTTIPIGDAEMEILEAEELELPDIGDSSAGFTTLARMMGVSVRTETGTFRRNETLAYTVVVYPSGDASIVQLEDLLRLLDDRIMQGSPLF